MQPNDIVITGMGVVTPLGCTLDDLWEAMLAARDGISELDCFDPEGFKFKHGGQVRHFNDEACDPACMDRATCFAVDACRQALSQAGLCKHPDSRAATALITATNFGGVTAGESLLGEAAGHGHSNALDSEAFPMHSGAGQIGNTLELGGLRTTLSLSCASGAAALAQAALWIRSGRADRVLTVGYDALSRFAWSGLSALRTMTRDCIRPFDANRKGTLFSEGAGALLIERADLAAARGATPLAGLAGWATNNNGFHLTAPAKQGAGSAAVMRAAIEQAGISADAVDHVNAHATGTRHNDITETQALYTVFGERAAQIPVAANKASLGHLMGAAGSVESVLTVLSLQRGCIPPTRNHETPDPDCRIDLVTGAPREVSLRTALSNSAGIGGCNAAVVLTAPWRGGCRAVRRP